MSPLVFGTFPLKVSFKSCYSYLKMRVCEFIKSELSKKRIYVTVHL